MNDGLHALSTDSTLERLAGIAREAGSAAITEEAERELRRVREGRFYVACLGQFKRGKSSLLNALVGEQVLPVGVIPVTAIVTVLRFGNERAARVRLADGEWQSIEVSALSDYVTEAANPGNRMGVAGVEVFMPSTLLASGLSLVDTPGVGSVFVGGTAATKAFVPHIDAALVVLGADPPISADEMELIESVAREVDDLLVVLNKADRLSADERREAIAFTRQVIATRIGREIDTIFEVSAAERLAGVDERRDWDRFTASLDSLARNADAPLVRRAGERAALRIGRLLLHQADEQLRALERPLDESERRIETLRLAAQVAEQSMADLTYLFTSEQQRLSRAFLARREQFLARAWPNACEDLHRALEGDRSRPGPNLRRHAEGLADEIARQHLERWRAEILPDAERMYTEAMTRFVTEAEMFLGRLAESGDPALLGLPRTVEVDLGFRIPSRFFYQMHWVSHAPWTALLDLVRPREGGRRAIERSAIRELDHHFQRHSTRLVNDLDQLVLESRRRLETEIRAQFRALHQSAEQALERARERRGAGADAVREEVERLRSLRRSVLLLLGEGPTTGNDGDRIHTP